MRVELKQAWKTWPVGHVFTDMPDNVASELIRRGIGVQVKAGAQKRGAGMRAGRDYVTR